MVCVCSLCLANWTYMHARKHCFCILCKLSSSLFGLFILTTHAVSPQRTHYKFRKCILPVYFCISCRCTLKNRRSCKGVDHPLVLKEYMQYSHMGWGVGVGGVMGCLGSQGHFSQICLVWDLNLNSVD